MNPRLWAYALSVLSKEVLLRYGSLIGRCVNPPYIISFVVTERCNARCTTCDLWKNQDSGQELSPKECGEIFRQLKKLTPHCAINFTGGEPLIRRDLYEILKGAHDLGFYTTLSSNGVAFDPEHCDGILQAGVDYINFSVNSIDPKVHDASKGIAGLHEKILRATSYIKERNKAVRICFCVIVAADNYKTLDSFVPWALKAGADTIDFIPLLSGFTHDVRKDGPALSSHSDPLMPSDNLPELDRQIDLLIKKKKQGFPIVTPEYYLKDMKLYYRNPQRLPPKKHCQVGSRNLHILPNGDTKLCYCYPTAGNIRRQSLKEIWFGEKTQDIRKDILKCSVPCICSVFREYSFMDKLSIFLMRAGLNRKNLENGAL